MKKPSGGRQVRESKRSGEEKKPQGNRERERDRRRRTSYKIRLMSWNEGEQGSYLGKKKINTPLSVTRSECHLRESVRLCVIGSPSAGLRPAAAGKPVLCWPHPSPRCCRGPGEPAPSALCPAGLAWAGSADQAIAGEATPQARTQQPNIRLSGCGQGLAPRVK